jgi:hypothetical protein
MRGSVSSSAAGGGPRLALASLLFRIELIIVCEEGGYGIGGSSGKVVVRSTRTSPPRRREQGRVAGIYLKPCSCSLQLSGDV